MGLFGNKTGDVVAGRAKVVPFATGWSEGSGGESGNVNNWSANSRARTRMLLTGVSASDGGPINDGHHEVIQPVQNWLRLVMDLAGDTRALSYRLPAELEVPVFIDRERRTIVRVDVDAAAVELAEYREVGRKEFLETEAPLAGVRNVIALPKAARKLARGVRPAMKDLAKDLRALGEPSGPGHPVIETRMDPKELEQLRRTAVGVGHIHQRNAKALERSRKSALQAGPAQAANVHARQQTVSSFEAWLMFQTLSLAITDEEAADYRRAAGLPRDEAAPADDAAPAAS